MKILHVIQSMDPVGGGPPLISFHLAAAQAGLGHEVHTLSYSNGRDTERMAEEFAAVPHGKLVQMHQLQQIGILDRLTAYGARQTLRGLVAQVDVVHLHGVWEPLLLAAAKIARQLRRPYFVLVNGMLDEWALSQKRLKKFFALWVAYRRMLDHSAGLHIANGVEEERIRPLGLVAARVVIPNGVSLGENEWPAKDDFHKLHPELEGKAYILFLGRLHPKKGLDYLIDAIAEVGKTCPEVRLVIAGPDNGAQAGAMEQVRRLGLERRVHFVGPQYGPEKRAALAGAFAFAFPAVRRVLAWQFWKRWRPGCRW